MEITDVKLRKSTKDGKMKAIGSVIFDNEFIIRDIKIISGEKGLFIAMPSKKCKDGEFRDIAHPLNSETRNKIQVAMLEKYNMLWNPHPSYEEEEAAISMEYVQ